MSESKDNIVWVDDHTFINMTKISEELKKREIPEAERGQLKSLVDCPCLTASEPCDEHRHLIMPRAVNKYVFGDGDGSGIHNQWNRDDVPPDTHEEE